MRWHGSHVNATRHVSPYRHPAKHPRSNCPPPKRLVSVIDWYSTGERMSMKPSTSRLPDTMHFTISTHNNTNTDRPHWIGVTNMHRIRCLSRPSNRPPLRIHPQCRALSACQISPLAAEIETILRRYNVVKLETGH